MNDIRLIASDVDGTMLPRGGEISENLRRAIGLCRERGIPFIIASGRWTGALGGIVAQAGTQDMPMIAANGAAVVGPGNEVLREWPLPDADTRRVYDILRGFEVQINAYLRDALYVLNSRAISPLSWLGRGYLDAGAFRLVMDDQARFEAEALHGAIKLEALSDDPAVVARMKAALGDTGLSVTHSSGRNVEITAPGVGKGAALRWLAGELGIPMESCMAFGDNMNDSDLLGAVGWPVAMANGDPALQRMARLVAPADTEDGVAKVIFEYALEEQP